MKVNYIYILLYFVLIYWFYFSDLSLVVGCEKLLLAIIMIFSGDHHCESFHQTKLETDVRLFQTNVFSVVNMTRCLLPHMMQRNSGHVAVVTCTEAVLASPYMATVTGYKQVTSPWYHQSGVHIILQALCGYFKSLRHEVIGCGISVSILALGRMLDVHHLHCLIHTGCLKKKCHLGNNSYRSK